MNLTKNTVLVLNKAWQAVRIETPMQAIPQMMKGSVTPLDIDDEGNMIPVKSWSDWMALPVRDRDQSIGTVHGPIRAPLVVVCARYNKVPLKAPKFNGRAIRARDKNICQYSGRVIDPNDGSLDHVIPLSRGGSNSFTNVVWSDKRINHKKGAKTPDEAGLKLIRVPVAPKPVPVTMMLRNPGIPDWEPFLPTRSN